MNIILTVNFSVWSAYSGGGQRATHSLALALRRRGHNVSVVYTKTPWETVDWPADLPYDVYWAKLFGREALLNSLTALSVVNVVRNLLDEMPDAIVHAHGEEGGMIHRLRRSRKFGFVSTPHYPSYPAALLADKDLSPWQTARLALTKNKYVMQGRTAREADLCVPPSAYAADMVRRAFGIDSSKLRVVHNGVPEEFLGYEHKPESSLQGPVVFFGRFDLSKGIDTLIEALGIIGASAPPSLIIGRGSRESWLTERIRTLGLQSKFKIVPWMTHDELADTLTGAGMVVLPSRHENFSLAVLSALAVGAPVISTHVGGTPEIIEDMKTGLLVEPNNPEALAGAIRKLLETPRLAATLGQAGRDHVRERFTWDKAAEKFEALYRSLPIA